MGKHRLVLLYHITESEQKKIENALTLMGVRILFVPASDYLSPIGALIGESGFACPKEPYTGAELPETMMVMSGFDINDVDTLLKRFRSNGIPSIPLKAVVTPTNKSWNSIQLFLELKREHGSMQ